MFKEYYYIVIKFLFNLGSEAKHSIDIASRSVEPFNEEEYPFELSESEMDIHRVHLDRLMVEETLKTIEKEALSTPSASVSEASTDDTSKTPPTPNL